MPLSPPTKWIAPAMNLGIVWRRKTKKKFNYPKKRNATEVFFGFVFLPFPLTISFLGNFQCFKMLKTKHTKLDLYILFFSWEMTTKILNIYLQDYVNQIKFKTELWKHFFFIYKFIKISEIQNKQLIINLEKNMHFPGIHLKLFYISNWFSKVREII